MSKVIEVENLGKKYIITHQRQEQYTTLRDVIVNSVKEATKKIIHPSRIKKVSASKYEEFWALKNISFDIEQGDRIGIIGRNGAGKTTLLKILSRITEPTEGRVKIKGRVASLLEIGTGFHPELTGRENIFLNGAILGMSKNDIKKKFNEIVGFAEVEKFIDTPVKRYSSGMYVRLAFAVAAHLEPEILLVDEVLAVGDFSFQKKCLGKMKEVSNEGRTVIFVSHNMGAIRLLCGYGIYLKDGKLIKYGGVQDVIAKYLSSEKSKKGSVLFSTKKNKTEASIKSIAIRTYNSNTPVTDIPFQGPFLIEILIEARQDIEAILGVTITNIIGEIVTSVHTLEIGQPEKHELKELCKINKGINKFILQFYSNYLRPGEYIIKCGLFSRKLVKNYDSVQEGVSFKVLNYNNDAYFDERQSGIFFSQDLKWRKS